LLPPSPSLSTHTPTTKALTTNPSGSRHDWAVFNDFCITPVAVNEVLQWYEGQKRPCILVYTQVGCWRAPHSFVWSGGERWGLVGVVVRFAHPLLVAH